MSSHTQPQKVHVALLMTLRLINSYPANTVFDHGSHGCETQIEAHPYYHWWILLFIAALRLGGFVRTGRRNKKRSTKRSAGIAASDTSRHEAAFVDFFPCCKFLQRLFCRKMRRFVGDEICRRIFIVNHLFCPLRWSTGFSLLRFCTGGLTPHHSPIVLSRNRFYIHVPAF